MFCSNCGSRVKENAMFCSNCGECVAENDSRDEIASTVQSNANSNDEMMTQILEEPPVYEEAPKFHSKPEEHKMKTENPKVAVKLNKKTILGVAVITIVAVIGLFFSRGGSSATHKDPKKVIENFLNIAHSGDVEKAKSFILMPPSPKGELLSLAEVEDVMCSKDANQIIGMLGIENVDISTFSEVMVEEACTTFTSELTYELVSSLDDFKIYKSVKDVTVGEPYERTVNEKTYTIVEVTAILTLNSGETVEEYIPFIYDDGKYTFLLTDLW